MKDRNFSKLGTEQYHTLGQDKNFCYFHLSSDLYILCYINIFIFFSKKFNVFNYWANMHVDWISF